MKLEAEDLLRYIRGYINDHGFPPSQAEMAIHFMVSRATVVKRLEELARSGRLKWARGTARSIREMT